MIEDDIFLTEKELFRRTGLSARFWQSRRAAGTGPPYIKISNRCVRYGWKTAVVPWLKNMQVSVKTIMEKSE